MTFSGLFLRHFMGEKPGFSGTAPFLADSPDIILQGTSPVDPGTLATSDSYNTEPPATLWVGSKRTNWVYVRALNTMGAPVDGRLWLWYMDSSMLNWPQNWKTTDMVVDGQNQNWVDVHASSANQIVVGNPFAIVSPDAPQNQIVIGDTSQNHYCMIAISESQQTTIPQAPFPGYMPTYAAFTAWVAQNPNVAWRNTIDHHVDGPGATWNWASPFPGPDQGPAVFNVGVQLLNMPIGSQYQWTVPGGSNANGTWPTLDSGVLTVKDPNKGDTTQTTWPGAVVTTMNITWWANGTTPQPGATIVPSVGYSTGFLEGVLEDPMKGAVMVEVQTDPFDVDSVEIQFQHIIGGIPHRLLTS